MKSSPTTTERTTAHEEYQRVNHCCSVLLSSSAACSPKLPAKDLAWPLVLCWCWQGFLAGFRRWECPTSDEQNAGAINSGLGHYLKAVTLPVL